MNIKDSIEKRIFRTVIYLPLFILSVLSSKAAVRLPKLISDGMVLQRDQKLNIWGWAAPGERVTINFNRKKLHVNTGRDGKWLIVLPAMKAGGPYTMRITASNTIRLSDILIGEVWLCSGQSNMQMPFADLQEKYRDEITHASNNEIRQFLIPNKIDSPQVHQDLTGGQWLKVNPFNILQFSGTAYFFAQAIYKKYHIPVGIINASWGGTPIEAWISERGLKDFPKALQSYRNLTDTASINRINALSNRTNIIERERTSKKYDQGLNGSKTWYDASYNADKTWRQIQVPGYWNDQGIRQLNGVVWYRKEIDLPLSMTGEAGVLYLGRLVSSDETYVNGVFCGQSSHMYVRRRYMIPANVLKPGKNVITVRVVCPSGKGGFVPGKLCYLELGNQSVDLTGLWLYKVGQVFEPVKPDPKAIQFTLAYQPVQLYNIIIAPLVNYSIKGIVWYQGESNTGDAKVYEKLLSAYITDYRKTWNKELPFIYAQLPNYMETQYTPSESQWAELREAQSKALALPNTGMAVTIDIGEWNDIHPLNKKDVGERLALAAEKTAYHEKELVASGPTYKSLTPDHDKLIINFNNTGSGLIAKGDSELRQFAIAGADKKFIFAKAIIQGDKVIVSAEGVDHPLYVRYAWADNPDGANLYNVENLPASPFRTDQE
jgi:sialate O-acetylesterase